MAAQDWLATCLRPHVAGNSTNRGLCLWAAGLQSTPPPVSALLPSTTLSVVAETTTHPASRTQRSEWTRDCLLMHTDRTPAQWGRTLLAAFAAMLCPPHAQLPTPMSAYRRQGPPAAPGTPSSLQPAPPEKHGQRMEIRKSIAWREPPRRDAPHAASCREHTACTYHPPVDALIPACTYLLPSAVGTANVRMLAGPQSQGCAGEPLAHVLLPSLWMLFHLGTVT